MGESVARIPIRVRVPGVGEAAGELNRLTAPLTVGDILKCLPISSRTIPSRECVTILFGLRRGTEKAVSQVGGGTIVFNPRDGNLCIYIDASKTYSPVNRVGSIMSKLEMFRSLRSGSMVIIEKA
jgi:hypothetical protein